LSSLKAPLAQALDGVPADWQRVIQPWRDSAAGQGLVDFVDRRVAEGAVVFPPEPLRALGLTPLAQVRVLILGQDPYHGAGQAHGLAFSVPAGVALPPSLRNIVKELRTGLGVAPPTGDLSGWAAQGVLLLNTTLTVEESQPASHARRGWEPLTERIVRAVAERRRPCVYLLWGAHAQQFAPLLREEGGPDALVLCSNHPSPLSARRPPVPFLGNGHFAAAQRHLAAHGGPIDWGRGGLSQRRAASSG